MLNQEQMQQMRREQEEAACTDPQTPLTATAAAEQREQRVAGEQWPPPDLMAMVVIRSGTITLTVYDFVCRSPTHLQFSNEQQGGGSSRTSKLSGILGEIQRLGNKSGSTSREA